MKENFHNIYDRIGFLLLVLFVSFNSYLLPDFFLNKKEDLYCSSRLKEISRDICYHIFIEAGKIDVLFLGFSSLWVGLDSKSIEKDLSLNRNSKVVVRTIGMNHPGEDILEILAKDLLARRKVKEAFISQPNRSTDRPHPYIHHILTRGDIGEGLGVIEKIRLNGLVSLRFFKNLMSVIFPYRKEWSVDYSSPWNGSTPRASRWKKAKNLSLIQAKKSIRQYRPILKAYKNNVIGVNSIGTVSMYQQKSLERLRNTLYSKKTNLNLIYMPLYPEIREKNFKLRVNDSVLENVPIWGQENFFAFEEINDNEAKTFFYNNNHLNNIGTYYFSRAFVKLYKELYFEKK